MSELSEQVTDKEVERLEHYALPLVEERIITYKLICSYRALQQQLSNARQANELLRTDLAAAQHLLQLAKANVAFFEQRVGELAAALRKYGQHSKMCAWSIRTLRDLPCNCGYNAALSPQSETKE